MEKNRFKLRISNMFRSSYASCNSKKINNDILQKPQNLQHFQLIEPFSPRPLHKPFSYLCKHKKCLEVSQNQENYKLNIKFPPRSKISERQHLLHPAENYVDSLKCPPVSPLDSFECKKKSKMKKTKKTKTRKSRSRSKTCDILDFQGFEYNGLFSSDEESEDEEQTTLFSSRSISSFSSDSTKRNKPQKIKKSLRTCKKNRGGNKECEKKGSLSLRGSFAVVKNSRDPYNDFRTSMVEMIMEKNISSAEDLENMLQCFLSLNSYHHHRIIIEVFTQICEALFSSST
ncbi:hypothetical protein LIER_25305 [Lithospermum erythrorhizon]|uniref:Transcription repressor n=1 Tax=Lithospermum erythrorhizon TaxID=34254 RepID=A0AAV3R5T4_LITER